MLSANGMRLRLQIRRLRGNGTGVMGFLVMLAFFAQRKEKVYSKIFLGFTKGQTFY
jgi:hypothetical protein